MLIYALDTCNEKGYTIKKIAVRAICSHMAYTCYHTQENTSANESVSKPVMKTQEHQPLF